MVSYLLDTNHLGRLINLRHPLRARLQAAIDDGGVFYIILPVITETIAGFSILPRAKQNQAEWEVLRPLLTLQQLDETDAVEAAQLSSTAPSCWTAIADGRCPNCRYSTTLQPDTFDN